MSRPWTFYTQFLGLTAAILLASAVGLDAIGQAAPAALSTDCAAYASVPLPSEAEKVAVPKGYPACASYRSYRGIGRPVNYSAARACAWRERAAQQARLGQNPKEITAWVVGGSLILADIYFNGAGVQRNVPLAMKFACEFEEGTAMSALPHIENLNGARPAHGPFEFCDYAQTTFTENFCTDYASEIAQDRRDRCYNSLKSSMAPMQRTAFDKLLAAQKGYVAAHASEVYQGGTIHSIRTIGSEEILNDLFRTELVQFERKEWPKLSEDQVRMADGLLEREYEKQLRQLGSRKPDEVDGAVTAKDLASVEKSWESYREAWVAFARLRYPEEVGAIRAKITLDRYRLVKTIW